ncbi:MAG: hypothetical protein ACLUMK_12835 [Christensenellales bacterium]
MRILALMMLAALVVVSRDVLRKMRKNRAALAMKEARPHENEAERPFGVAGSPCAAVRRGAGGSASMLLALYNVGGGPLGNLNDIGGWRNRALYIALTAAVQLFVLLAAALLYHERFWRLAVRQLLLTVGL